MEKQASQRTRSVPRAGTEASRRAKIFCLLPSWAQKIKSGLEGQSATVKERDRDRDRAREGGGGSRSGSETRGRRETGEEMRRRSYVDDQILMIASGTAGSDQGDLRNSQMVRPGSRVVGARPCEPTKCTDSRVPQEADLEGLPGIYVPTDHLEHSDLRSLPSSPSSLVMRLYTDPEQAQYDCPLCHTTLRIQECDREGHYMFGCKFVEVSMNTPY